MGSFRVANAPCSWGVLEFELEGKALTGPEVLSQMAEAGYEGTEFGDWGFLPTEPKPLGQTLAERGLALVGAFVPVAFVDPSAHEEGIAVALKTARLLAAVNPQAMIVLADNNGSVAARRLNAGRITPDLGLSSQQWDIFGKGVEKVARAVLLETGLRSVFHHHCAGFVETPDEVEALLTRTSPELVNLCLDTGHWAFGGGDPVEALARWRDRIGHIHFKDHSPEAAQRVRKEELDYFAAVRAGVFCELGKGDVDFAAVLSGLGTTEADRWIVVEQDVLPGMGTPYESAVRNRQFLKGLGL